MTHTDSFNQWQGPLLSCPGQLKMLKKDDLFNKKEPKIDLKKKNKNTDNSTNNTKNYEDKKINEQKENNVFLLSWPVTGIPGVPSPFPKPHIGFFRPCLRIQGDF